MLLAATWIAASGAIAPVAASNVVAIDTAVASCERWLLEPESWSNDIAGFGRGTILKPVMSIPDALLPPFAARVAMHHWQVPLMDGGVFVTTSDRMPICHVASGGQGDLQPSVKALIQSPEWNRRWKAAGSNRRGEMTSQQFVSLRDPKLTMTLSYAAAPGGRTDRVQLIATAQYHIGN